MIGESDTISERGREGGKEKEGEERQMYCNIICRSKASSVSIPGSPRWWWMVWPSGATPLGPDNMCQ